MQIPSLGQEDPLEKEMATHSNIPAWKIPWTEAQWCRKELDMTELLSSHVHTHTHTHILIHHPLYWTYLFLK